MVVSELRGEKIDIIPWNTEPARFVAKALSPARVREVYIDDETKEATVVVPNDQLALAIGKEGLNARLAARLTGWKVDIQSDEEFAQAEAEAAFAGAGEGDGEVGDFSGRCAAILSNGKRCPNASLAGTRYCGVPAHQALVGSEPEEVPAEEVEEVATQAGSSSSRSPRSRRLQSKTNRSLRIARTRRLHEAGALLCRLRPQGSAGGARPLCSAGWRARRGTRAVRARRLHVPPTRLFRAGRLQARIQPGAAAERHCRPRTLGALCTASRIGR